MIQPLQLRYRPGPQAAPDAWFLPGAAAAGWLAELARCGLAGMETRLFVVPRSVESRQAAGLLVVPATPGSVAELPAGLGCRLLAGRLFVPLDAVLHPPLTEAEVRALCALPVSFLHPTLGLSGFEAEAALRVSDLLQPPGMDGAAWNLAQAGAPALPSLTAIVLHQPISLDELFGEAEREIGSEPPEALPPAPDEPKEDRLSREGRRLRGWVAGGLAEALRRLPHLAAQRTWLNDVEDWANRQLRGVGEQLERLRNKELHRLLHMLDTDPEAGLRHAIPMNQFPHRGVAPPSARLGSRSPHFHLERLGGQPVDYWAVPDNLQEVLRRRYREMADREMQLGRHRRAAYIYAELLGDLVSAANALRQGGLYREAALIYEEHLKNPLEAARCLAQGGLLAEAIERYEKLGCWLEVAELHERAGNYAAAEQAVRRVVQERLAQHDVLGAAKLLEERLHAQDEALELLWQAWPAAHQAAHCLGAAFQLLARLGRHQVTLERLARLQREPVPDALVLPLLATLGPTARDYPHALVRHDAADLSRVLVARRLQQPGLGSDEAGSLLANLVGLAPQDRLLARDANRYLAGRRGAEQRARRVTPPPTLGRQPAVLRRFELPRQIQWLRLRRGWSWFYALGVTAKRLTLLRGTWEGRSQSLSWECPAEAVRHGFVFEPNGEPGRGVILARAGGAPLLQKRFPAADRFFYRECTAGTPCWLPAQGFPVAVGDNLVWTLHLAAGRAVLSGHDLRQGQLQQTRDLTDALLDGAERSEETLVSLAAVGNSVAVTLGNRLVLAKGDGGVARIELPGQAVGLVATIPTTRPAVAVLLQAGAVLYWLGTDACLELDGELAAPRGAFVPGGPLVLASGTRLVLLEADSRGVHGVARLDLDGQRAVDVSGTGSPGEFAVLGDKGEVTVYRMPRER